MGSHDALSGDIVSGVRVSGDTLAVDKIVNNFMPKSLVMSVKLLCKDAKKKSMKCTKFYDILFGHVENFAGQVIWNESK